MGGRSGGTLSLAASRIVFGNLAHHREKQVDEDDESEGVLLAVSFDNVVSCSVAEEGHDAAVEFHRPSLLSIIIAEPQQPLLWAESQLHKGCPDHVLVTPLPSSVHGL